VVQGWNAKRTLTASTGGQFPNPKHHPPTLLSLLLQHLFHILQLLALSSPSKLPQRPQHLLTTACSSLCHTRSTQRPPRSDLLPVSHPRVFFFFFFFSFFFQQNTKLVLDDVDVMDSLISRVKDSMLLSQLHAPYLRAPHLLPHFVPPLSSHALPRVSHTHPTH